ncbi:MAG TPA: hypothetical protein PKB02_09605 [Anaerohalosphaeraceae bacterium]|nr:hypothetical protein [Anaerohalosphaeraceae bacterium]
MKTAILCFAVMAGLALTGCSKVVEQKAVPPSGHFYLDKTADFSSVGRVAILELENQSVSQAELSKVLTQELSDGIGKKHLFSIQSVYQADNEWQSLELNRIKTFSIQDWAAVRKQLKVDALIFGTVTRYRSYPQFLVALNIKMIDLRDGKLLWAIEDVWDSTDKNTELRIKEFYETQMRNGYQPMEWQVVLNSPKAFHKYVIYEVTRTLPENK